MIASVILLLFPIYFILNFLSVFGYINNKPTGTKNKKYFCFKNFSRDKTLQEILSKKLKSKGHIFQAVKLI